MSRVSLWMQMSLDGFVEGPDGAFDWPVVKEEVHRYFNDELRAVDSFLYGRKVYDGMAAFWPTVEAGPSSSPRHVEYAEIWKPMPKIVFSRTLAAAGWNTRVVRDDIAGEVAKLKGQPGTHHVLFGGAEIASAFMRLDLIDEYRLFVHPVALAVASRSSARWRTGSTSSCSMRERSTAPSCTFAISGASRPADRGVGP